MCSKWNYSFTLSIHAFVTDMNALHSHCLRSHSNDDHGHLQHHSDVLLHSVLDDMEEDPEYEGTEEKIVYL